MAIESCAFRGTKPPHSYSANETEARAQLNRWREKNRDESFVRVINIETLMTGRGGEFDGFRVWFETSEKFE